MVNTDIPPFLKRDGDAILYNGTGELIFYIPEEYFGENSHIIEIQGSYVSMIGICEYALFDKNGKQLGDFKTFKFPTMMLCKPDRIEKVSGLKLGKSVEKADYRLLHFTDGDEVITTTNVPMLIDSVEVFFSMMIITGKIPTTIPYDKIHEYFLENAQLNDFSYNMNMQLFGVMLSKICRDPKDVSREFRLSPMTDMNNYRPISIKEVPNYVSPYVSITSENFDESLMAAITSDSDKYSPLEKVLTL